MVIMIWRRNIFMVHWFQCLLFKKNKNKNTPKQKSWKVLTSSFGKYNDLLPHSCRCGGSKPWIYNQIQPLMTTNVCLISMIHKQPAPSTGNTRACSEHGQMGNISRYSTDLQVVIHNKNYRIYTHVWVHKHSTGVYFKTSSINRFGLELWMLTTCEDWWKYSLKLCMNLS